MTPVLPKKKHQLLERELRARFENLMYQFTQNELTSKHDGAPSRSSWAAPELMCKTNGDSIDIRLACEDFKSILKEISSLK